MARPNRIQDGFSFGGRLPWAVGLLLSATLVLSLISAFGGRHDAPLVEALALYPADVWRGQLWRLATWVFIEPGPIGLILTSLFLFWFGRDLAGEWGSPRFLAVFGGVTLFAGLMTCLVAQVDRPVLAHAYLGGWAMTAALCVAWGLWFPDRVVRMYFVLPVRGYWLAWLTVALTLIFAVYSGWEGYLPEIFAEGGALGWLYRRPLVARWAKAKRALDARRREAERRERVKRARSAAHLRVVHAFDDDDDDPPPLPPEVEDKVRDLFGGPRKR